MKIGIDIDDTISNSFESVFAESQKFDIEELGNNGEVKQYGRPNDLIDRIANDETFGLSKEEILNALNPDNLCGRAPHQVDDFIAEKVQPVLDKYVDLLQYENIEIKV